MKQLVYRRECFRPMDVSEVLGSEFRLFSSPLGSLGVVKAGLKLATGKRRFYCVLVQGSVAHYGWVSFSFCRFYRVQTGDVVIGPIMTDARFRGRGYATLALMRVMNALITEGSRVFWIDTSEDNIPCQKVINKCGFGKPVECFEK